MQWIYEYVITRILEYTNVHKCKYQICKYANMWIHESANMQINVQRCEYAVKMHLCKESADKRICNYAVNMEICSEYENMRANMQ